MIQTQVTILHKEAIAPAWWRLTISAPDLTPPPHPGQFLLLRCADHFSCYLRRPVYPAFGNQQQFDLLIRPDPDPGLAWLSARQPGQTLDVIGPLGRGFPLANQAHNLLLVSNEPMLSPLLGQLDRAVAAGVSVALALGATRASALYPAAALPPIVEFQAATLDGSQGHHGPVTDLLPDLLSWADAVCAVGSISFYRRLRQQVEKVRLGATTSFLYGLLATNPMACGVGACLSCALAPESGLKLACVDGPVFDLMTIDL